MTDEERAKELLNSPDAKRADEMLMAWQDRGGDCRSLHAFDYAALLGDVIRFANAVRADEREANARIREERDHYREKYLDLIAVEVLEPDARCRVCGHFEIGLKRASDTYAHCPACGRAPHWIAVPVERKP